MQIFDSGGSRISHWGGGQPIGGHRPPMHMLFGKNVCENERIGSCWGAHAGGAPGSANANAIKNIVINKI